ncbi:unnamed protein product [Lepeophtheirus salmonis]|uniref:(salmon louse) hypothetical protein n=1 Tax=Lepeophtheirus salmonis TaxID=72036 RepID=A0A7R8GZF1_LEPSM|nr:unnamed protein product [Lepeophtheirus salmonis]CAF2752665.1 unnamed protein product [Lepeophtheirus salmonis]
MFGLVSVDSKPKCLDCCAILTNDSMKKVKLEHHQKSKHPFSVGKDREFFENKNKVQLVKLFDFVKNINSVKGKKLNPGYFSLKLLPRLEHLWFTFRRNPGFTTTTINRIMSFILWNNASAVLLGTLNLFEMHFYPSPDLWVSTILVHKSKLSSLDLPMS